MIFKNTLNYLTQVILLIQERIELIELHESRVHNEIIEQQKYLKLLGRKLKYYDVIERCIDRRSMRNTNIATLSTTMI